MASYQIYVRDDRRPTPRLSLNLVTDETRLNEIARRVLAESVHYKAVEVFDQDGRRFGEEFERTNGPPCPGQVSGGGVATDAAGV
ncbi:MAG TPA: hypothetical protein VGF33_09815 [Caulobacteraceae bacterium]|jgi:hypothetical protein